MFGTFIFKVLYIFFFLNILWLFQLVNIFTSINWNPKGNPGTFIMKLFAPQLTVTKQDPRQDKVPCHQLLSSLWRWMLSPLMFGHVHSVHHCHTRPSQLLRGNVCVELSHHGAVIWSHTAPWPVVWDPGVGQALPNYHAVACRRKRHKEMGEVSRHVGLTAT